MQVRYLNLHEYQSKQLMEQHGINTQQFKIAATAEEAERAARELGELGLRIDNHFLGSEENKALSEPSRISRPIFVPSFLLSLFLSFSPFLFPPPFPLSLSLTFVL